MTLEVRHNVGSTQYFPVQYIEHDDQAKTAKIIYLANSFAALPNGVLQQDLREIETRETERHFDKPYLAGVLDCESIETKFILHL